MKSSVIVAGDRPTSGKSQAPHRCERFRVVGMTCASEAAGLERRLRQMEGLESVNVNPITEIAYVTFDDDRLGPEGIEAAIEQAGYGVWNVAGKRPLRG